MIDTAALAEAERSRRMASERATGAASSRSTRRREKLLRTKKSKELSCKEKTLTSQRLK